MCGIIAYAGKQPASIVLIEGLKRLEYRGYDSAGIAIMDPKNYQLKIFKKKGKVINLETYCDSKKEAIANFTTGIGHTRWATHGEPSDKNAHPHFDSLQKIALVHNGIIENYEALKSTLIKKGYQFVSQTDTEVLVMLISDAKREFNLSIEEAVRVSLNKVIGAYAIVVIDVEEPNKLVAARKGSPLLIGIANDLTIVASDASAIIQHTNQVIYLKDGEVACLQNNSIEIKTLSNENKPAYVKELDMHLSSIDKGNYDHFMLKEIMEQPITIADSMRGRINAQNYKITIGGLNEYLDCFKRAKRIVFIACGTSWHAGLVAKYFFEEFGRVPVQLEYASEFRYSKNIINTDDIVIAISQSGETADTLVAVQKAKEAGAVVLGICNVTGSSLSRLTDAGVYTHAGLEIGVASTKAFTSQLTVLYLIGMELARVRNTVRPEKYLSLSKTLYHIPDNVTLILERADKIKLIADKYYNATSMLYLGRSYNFAIALEGALKLKEISYIHAEGYPAAEMKHGPIALIDKDMPVVFIAPKDQLHKKLAVNIEETKARQAKIITVANPVDKLMLKLSEDVMEIPEISETSLYPLLTVIPLQLFAYYIALRKGTNVDQPRNLAKSVTVE